MCVCVCGVLPRVHVHAVQQFCFTAVGQVTQSDTWQAEMGYPDLHWVERD
jgi:hypothetical protein